MFDYNITNLKNTSEIPIGSWVYVTSVKNYCTGQCYEK